jgi:hypothetical protein
MLSVWERAPHPLYDTICRTAEFMAAVEKAGAVGITAAF